MSRLRRSSLRRCIPPLALALTLLPSLATAQGKKHTRLIGAVANASTGAPLENAVVRFPELHRSARTDQMGRFFIDDVPKGIFQMQVRQIGYAPSNSPLKFSGEDSLEAIIMLEPRVIRLDAVVVSDNYVKAPLQEFEQRRRTAIGRFLGEADLQQEHDRPMDLVVLARIPGVRAVHDGDLMATYLVSTRGVSSLSTSVGGVRQNGAPLCKIAVYLDGVALADGDVSWIRASDLAGIEHYSEAQAPAQYRVGATCGVILLWSKW